MAKRKEKHFVLSFSSIFQLLLGLITLMIINYVIIWVGYQQFQSYQVYIAASVPILLTVVRYLTRVVTLHIEHVNHPGSHYAFVIHMYAGSSLSNRIFHADLHTFTPCVLSWLFWVI